MLIKKIAISAVAAGLMLSSAAGAFAWGDWSGNWAQVNTTVTSTSNTGGNLMGVGGNTYNQQGSNWNGGSNGNGTTKHSYITTGNASTHTFVLQGTNTNVNPEGGYFNGAKVNTTVYSQSNTGNNVMGGGGNTYNQYGSNSNGGYNGNGTANHSYTTTGNAYTHTAVVNVVNTNLNLE